MITEGREMKTKATGMDERPKTGTKRGLPKVDSECGPGPLADEVENLRELVDFYKDLWREAIGIHPPKKARVAKRTWCQGCEDRDDQRVHELEDEMVAYRNENRELRTQLDLHRNRFDDRMKEHSEKMSGYYKAIAHISYLQEKLKQNGGEDNFEANNRDVWEG